MNHGFIMALISEFMFFWLFLWVVFGSFGLASAHKS